MLLRSSLRHLWQQRGLTSLALLAIGLAVALCVAVWQTNSSAVASFATTSERLQGDATHIIQGGPQGIDHRWYVEQRREGILRVASPKLQKRVLISSEDADGAQRRQRATLLGIDAFAAGELVSDFGTNGVFAADDFNRALMGEAIVFGQAGRWPDEVTLWFGGQQHQVRVIGADSSLVYLPDMLVADLATADRLLNAGGRLTEIDLALNDTAALAALEKNLPEGAVLRPGSALSQDLDALTAAFRLNLGALAGLACLVAIYLVISTINLWTVERQPWFAHLRTIGATPMKLVRIIFSEALMLGLVGAVIGFTLGQGAAVVTSALTAQTVQDFYANIPLMAASTNATSILLALLLGPLLAGLAAIPSAIQCWRLSPRQQSLQRNNNQATPAVWWGLTGLSAIFLAVGCLFIFASEDLLSGWIGMICLIFAITGFTPLVIWGAMIIGRPLIARFAPPSIIIGYGWPLRSLLRLGPATAALTLALAASLGVAVMVQAFRSNVTDWLGRVLSADIYISSEGTTISDEAIPLDPEILQQVRALSAEAHLTTIAQTDIVTLDPQSDATLPWSVTIIDSEKSIEFATIGSKDADEIWQQLQAGAVLVSEPLARQRGLQQGEHLQLEPFNSVSSRLTIAALVTDFTPDGGRITMHRSTAEALGWTYEPSGISLRFDQELNPAQATTYKK